VPCWQVSIISLLDPNQFNFDMLLKGPGGVMVALQIAGAAYYLLPFDWPVLFYFLFGAILCATDPVSVVDLLKTTKASSRLSTVIAGESLLNDGSAMILYFFVENMIKGKVYTVGTFAAFCAQMLLTSPLIGFIFGIVTFKIMKYISMKGDHMDFQIGLTFLCAYTLHSGSPRASVV
jgi:NhaP-type Na+/H+ or K+/H+ antiporter